MAVLEDKLTNTTHNLKWNSFTTEKDFNDRFVLT
jgi:hypothetical protein